MIDRCVGRQSRLATPHPANPLLSPQQKQTQVNNGVWELSSQCQLSSLVDALKMYKATYKVQLEPPAEK